MTFFETIRGVEVEVHAEDFDCDPSTGIEFGPLELWAETLSGKPFPLSDEDTERLMMKAAELAVAGDDDN